MYHYLDAAATAPLRPEAKAAMLAVLEEGPGNASSVHSAGHRANRTLEAARAAVGAALGARASEVIFTSGGTEANNLAVIGLSLANPRGKHLITTPVEHPSVLESCLYLERIHGFEVTMLRVDRTGTIDLSHLEEVLREDTTLVSIGLANGEVGTVQPLAQAVALVRNPKTLLHTDAVQAAATLPVSFGSGGWPGDSAHAMTVASHKFGGPQGAGALLLRGGIEIEPILRGGGQEGDRRSGTENLLALSGFAAAVTAAMNNVGSRAARLLESRNALVRLVLERVPGANLTGHPTERLPGHASFVVDGVSGESLLVALDVAGVAASSGSACAAGRDEPSPALIAMGVDATLAQTAIRFTLADPLDAESIDRIVEVLVRETRAALGKGR